MVGKRVCRAGCTRGGAVRQRVLCEGSALPAQPQPQARLPPTPPPRPAAPCSTAPLTRADMLAPAAAIQGCAGAGERGFQRADSRNCLAAVPAAGSAMKRPSPGLCIVEQAPKLAQKQCGPSRCSVGWPQGRAGNVRTHTVLMDPQGAHLGGRGGEGSAVPVERVQPLPVGRGAVPTAVPTRCTHSDQAAAVSRGKESLLCHLESFPPSKMRNSPPVPSDRHFNMD